jgi:hypothetical protein
VTRQGFSESLNGAVIDDPSSRGMGLWSPGPRQCGTREVSPWRVSMRGIERSVAMGVVLLGGRRPVYACETSHSYRIGIRDRTGHGRAAGWSNHAGTRLSDQPGSKRVGSILAAGVSGGLYIRGSLSRSGRETCSSGDACRRTAGHGRTGPGLRLPARCGRLAVGGRSYDLCHGGVTL